jgi:orotate phosphoribosyltransferase-like protein
VFVQIVIFQEHFACGRTVQLALKGVQEQQGNALLVLVVQEKLGHQ